MLKTLIGDRKLDFDFHPDDGELHGSVTSPGETNEILDGTVNGSELFWRNKVSRPIAMEIEMTANVDGDSISGGAKSPFGVAPFAGRRSS